VSFKENLTILLLSALFIVLAARMSMDQLVFFFTFKMVIFLLFIILFVRPFSVCLCTLGSAFSFKERLFLSFMAPRGIVAAAVASLFALQLLDKGYSQAGDLVSITFIVILGTVGVYGFLGIFLARFLGLSPAPNGVLIAGAHSWGRVFASFLVQYDIPVTLVDTNKENILAARLENLPVIHGSILSKAVIDEVEMSSMRCFLAITASVSHKRNCIYRNVYLFVI
jgi:NhaP-type Na+/H+ and K+/H+ antiporter